MNTTQHYLLIYDTAPDYLERRGAFRNEHLRLAWEAHARGEMVLGGACTEPFDSAVFIFKGTSGEAAERFASNDPYVKNGLITRWRVRHWMTVIGEQASAPARPT
jgi:uncharacterized protein